MTYYARQWNMTSFTNPDKSYKISLKPNGEFECSCPSWIFGRKKHEAGWVCKHIRHLQENMSHFGREEVTRAHNEGRRVTVQTSDYNIEVAEEGRMAGFIADL